MAKSQTQCWWVHLLCVQCHDSNILIWGRFLYDLSFFLGHSLNPAVSSLKHAVSAAEVCWCLGTFYYSCFHSLPTSLPQKRWQKWAPCWPRQAVGFCKLTTLIMSFCYSDTQSSGPPHWLKMGSDVKSSMSWGRSHVCNPPPPHPLMELQKEMEGLSALEGDSSLGKAAAKMDTGFYSGATALGKHISSES